MAKAASISERRRQLQDELRSLEQGAHDEIMARINADIRELGELGYRYRVVEGGRGRSGRGAGVSRKGTRQVKDAPCPVCGFKTNPPHDARAHRGQQEKKPFTAAELKAKGLEKVS